jgi:L-arabinose isomerase
MDFMNLNQSAHGGREFGYICTRLGINRSVVVGHWEDPDVRSELGAWCGAAIGWYESQRLKVARFGDNMRSVAVTEGDKVEAQISLGWQVDGYGLGDLVAYMDAPESSDVKALLQEYSESYRIPDSGMPEAAHEQARIELAMRRFLEEGGYGAFTTTFENLHGLRQLPGLAVQRLMADGYGFGAEGDWKTAALLRVVKSASVGIPGGTSFMEDYTYHFEPGNMQVLGSHMLEVCPSIASNKPLLTSYPLGIGGREDPARLIFDGVPGTAFNMSLIDMGDGFRMIVNAVEAITPQHDMPNLPVARVLWEPQPGLKEAAEAWILAGGAHHTVYTQQWDLRRIEIFCAMAGIETVVIDESTNMSEFRRAIQGA